MKERLKRVVYECIFQLYQKNIFHNKIHVWSVDDTLHELLASQKSLVRFGDAEMNMIEGNSVEFQEYDETLSKRMYEVLQFKNENLMVAIPDIFGGLENYTDKSQQFWKEHLFFFRQMYERDCNTNKVYFNAFVSRCYYMFRDKERSGRWFREWKQLWKDRDIVVVEGNISHNGVDNDLFEGVASIERVICPWKNAYAVYEKIREACLDYPNDRLFLTAIGNTAKVLTADLAAAGYRAIDIGNLDMEYDWYLWKADTKVHPPKHDYRTIEENLQGGYKKYVDEIKCIIE